MQPGNGRPGRLAVIRHSRGPSPVGQHGHHAIRCIFGQTTLTRKGLTCTAQCADVYHARDGKVTEHWHLAVGPKAEEELLTF